MGRQSHYPSFPRIQQDPRGASARRVCEFKSWQFDATGMTVSANAEAISLSSEDGRLSNQPGTAEVWREANHF
jgi:hypothetical protein